jgi:hypothetical protein
LYVSKIHFNTALPPTSRRSWDSSVGIVMSCWLGSNSWQGQEIVLCTPASRPALGSTQHPNQWVMAALSLGVKWLQC